MSRLLIVPSILTEDTSALESMFRIVEGFADYVQVDFMDGIFVPSRSVSPSDVAGTRPRIPWEAHLMVERPQEWLKATARAGAAKVIVHIESSADFFELSRRARRLGLRVGLALNPETPVADALSFLDDGVAESLLFLSVIPGFYGRPFIPIVLDKIVDIRRSDPDVSLGIDGGISEENLSAIALSGVDVAYVGSGILLAPDPPEAFRTFRDLAARI